MRVKELYQTSGGAAFWPHIGRMRFCDDEYFIDLPPNKEYTRITSTNVNLLKTADCFLKKLQPLPLRFAFSALM